MKLLEKERPTVYVNGKRYDLRYCILIADLWEIPENVKTDGTDIWGFDFLPKNRKRLFQSRGLKFLLETADFGKEVKYSVIGEEEAKRFCLDHPAAIDTDGYDKVFGRPEDG